MNSYLEEAINSGPFMLPFRFESAMDAWIWQELPANPVACLIEIETSLIEDVFLHLQNLLECVSPQGNIALFRFYDPRVAYGISTYEDAKIAAEILGQILYLNAWEPGRNVAITMGIGKDNVARCIEPNVYGEAFFEHIWDEARVHTTIGTLGRETGIKLRAMPLAEAYKLVEKVYHILQKCAYTDRYSLAYGTSATVRLGIDVWERVDLQEALKTRPAKAPLSELMESIDI